MVEINNSNSTHFVFDGEKIIISPDIRRVVQFLMGIEKEVVGVLDSKNNNVLRSQAIVLFASLEVLFVLYLAYNNKTSDKNVIIKLSRDEKNIKRFLNSFILTDNNTYYKNNKSRLSKIDSTKLRDLRNSLTHFFSVGPGGLSLAPSIYSEKARRLEKELEKNKKGYIVFISEHDLFELVKQANILWFKELTSDYQEDMDDFKNKIKHVINIVFESGAVEIQNKDLHI